MLLRVLLALHGRQPPNSLRQHILSLFPLQKGAHSAEWWIYQDSMRARPDGTSSVVRVLDQTQADVFFVPFMGSQAFLCADSAQYTLPDHGEVCGELRGKNHELAVRPHPSPIIYEVSVLKAVEKRQLQSLKNAA